MPHAAPPLEAMREKIAPTAGRSPAPFSVQLIMRKAGRGFYSVERAFDQVARELAGRVRLDRAEVPYESRGLLNRWRGLRWVGRLNADVLHVTGDIHYVALGLPGPASVLTVLDCTSLHRLRGWRRALLHALWYRWPVRHCRAVTAISHFSASELEVLGIIPQERVHVIPVPVDPAFTFEPRPFNERRPTLLHLGVTPNKNLPRVARALHGIPCRLQIVGRPDPEQEAALRAHEIDFTAEADVSDTRLRELYRACDMVVFASTYEGFGLPIVEAQATGRPVLTAAVASMPEVAGNGACLVDPFEVESIRAGLLRVLRKPAYREYLIAEGLRNVERFQVARIARQYEAVYEEIVRVS